MAEMTSLVVPQENFDTRSRCSSNCSVSSQVQETQELYPLFKVAISELPRNMCEKVMRDLGEAIVTSIQLDPETVSSLVAFQIINGNDGEQLRNASHGAESERVMDYLCPAVRRGGNRALESLYQVLMHTREGRMGHSELAKKIEKKVSKYVKPSPRHLDGSGKLSLHSNTKLRGLQLYRHRLSESLDFTLFGQAAEQSGFFKEADSERLAQLWKEDKEKAVSTLIEETEAKGPAGVKMLVNTLKCTLDAKEMDTATRERHLLLIDELSRVELLETSGNLCPDVTISDEVCADSTGISDGVVKHILHRLETLEEGMAMRTKADSTSGSELNTNDGSGREGQGEDAKPTPKSCDIPEHFKHTTIANEESDRLLQEKEELNAHLQEQVRTLTEEMEELKSTLQKRDLAHKEMERALMQERADLKDEVAQMRRKASDLEESCSLFTETEQKLAKEMEQSKLYKAALNTCRKRIKSLQGSSASDSVLPNDHELLSVEGLVIMANELCASVKDAHISEDVSQQRQKIMYFSLKDSLCQALLAVDQRLKTI